MARFEIQSLVSRSAVLHCALVVSLGVLVEILLHSAQLVLAETQRVHLERLLQKAHELVQIRHIFLHGQESVPQDDVFLPLLL